MALKDYLIWRQRGLCGYCEVNLLEVKQNQMTKDHIIAKSNGGAGRRSNLILSCKTCNMLKLSLDPDAFTAWISENKTSIQNYNLTFHARDST